MLKETIIAKMIDFYRGNAEDISHFLKVYAFAHTIGGLEGLDASARDTLEIAAIVHDIACPLCREKYGNTHGKHQEEESEALLEEFLREFALAGERKERIIFLVTHHHTYSGVDGMDYQILLEADYLVNAAESEKYGKSWKAVRENVFRTKTGIRFLEAEMGAGGERSIASNLTQTIQNPDGKFYIICLY